MVDCQLVRNIEEEWAVRGCFAGQRAAVEHGRERWWFLGWFVAGALDGSGWRRHRRNPLVDYLRLAERKRLPCWMGGGVFLGGYFDGTRVASCARG